ncbi:MAG TPA: ribonuclease Z [Bacteroidetes bacterium]|nr:ribonuclease Z [Bacteroidales bacterium]HHD82560.1 ribonuclease Z [Bacteroidota bacterium]
MAFTFTILGSSSALPTSKRFTSAYVLNIHERFFLIDCGEGTQMQLRKYKIKLGRINHIFISHIHGDHVFGLFGLISSFNLLGRKNDLHIFGPPDLEQIIHGYLKDFYINLFFEIIFHPVNCARSVRIYEDDKILVNSIPLKHRIPTCGFLFREQPTWPNLRKDVIEKYNIPISKRQGIKEGDSFITETSDVVPNSELVIPAPEPKKFAYCSDTSYNEGILTQIKNVDLLYHEATFGGELRELARETMHSTASEAARIAQKASVKKLVIGHFSARYKDITPLLEEARTVFENTFIAEDGKTFKV